MKKTILKFESENGSVEFALCGEILRILVAIEKKEVCAVELNKPQFRRLSDFLSWEADASFYTPPSPTPF
jgi:hypothetical protein